MIRTHTLAALAVVVTGSPCLAASAPPTEVRVYGFQLGGTDGAFPRGDLVLLPDKELYGTAAGGGTNNAGTVFRIKVGSGKNPSTEETIWNFDGATQGGFPSAALVADGAGALYGTTALDGTAHGGTVFRLTPPSGGATTWTETTLWSFGAGPDGATPLGALIFDQSGSGVLYGTTSFGGAYGLGTVFSLIPPKAPNGDWTEKELWSFSGGADGAKPVAALMQDENGVLYGTAEEGGAGTAGVVFSLSPPSSPSGSWSLSPIWTFTGGDDGATPVGTLIMDKAGVIYGTAQFGGSGFCPMTRWPYYGESDSVTEPSLHAPFVGVGANGCGVVFALSPPTVAGAAWTQTLPWSFAGGFDGANPVGKLIRVEPQTIWGTTPLYGGDPNSQTDYPSFSGNVFTLAPPSGGKGTYTETTVNSFQFKLGGFYPRGGLVSGPGNKYYVTDVFGGESWEHVKHYGQGEITAVDQAPR
jgi:uncharacterized repeat protein (TIGR03803 family)